MNLTRKWIEIAVNFRSNGEQYFAEEKLYEVAEKADRWVKVGWAKDLTGEVATGKPDTAPKTLDVANGVHNAATA